MVGKQTSPPSARRGGGNAHIRQRFRDTSGSSTLAYVPGLMVASLVDVPVAARVVGREVPFERSRAASEKQTVGIQYPNGPSVSNGVGKSRALYSC